MSSSKEKDKKSKDKTAAEAEAPVSSRDKSKSRDKEKSKEREKEKSKSRDKEKSKEREKEKSKSKSKSKSELRISSGGQSKTILEAEPEPIVVLVPQLEPAVLEKATPTVQAAPKETQATATATRDNTESRPLVPLSSQVSPTQILQHPDIQLQVDALLKAILDHSPAVVASAQQAQRPGNGSYASSSAHSHVFNSKLQDIVSLSENSRYKEISELLSDFARLSETYAKIIISELNLSAEEKTIRPVENSSETFFVKGITLRVARDYIVGDIEAQQLGLEKASWKFGGSSADDDAAVRAAGHEFAATNAAWPIFTSNGVAVPLSALIDYCGTRVIAQISLPIYEAASLALFGPGVDANSIPASSSMHKNKMADAIKTSLSSLNVENLSTETSGYRGSDGKYYISGLAQLYPVFDSKTLPGVSLRPELAKRLPQATSAKLSSTALSYLTHQLIPQYVAERAKSDEFKELFRSEFDNINDVHHFGINFRFLGRVRAEMHSAKQTSNDALLLAEMIARVLKNQTRSATRVALSKLTFFSEEPARAELLRVLNLIVHASQNESFWKGTIKASIVSWFGNESLHTHEKDPSFNLNQSLSGAMRFFVVWRLTALLGVDLPQNLVQDIRTSLTNPNGSAPFIASADLASSLRPRIKVPSLGNLSFSAATTMAALQAIDNNEAPASTATRLLGDARSRLFAAYDSAPSSKENELWVAKFFMAQSLISCPGGDSAALSRAAWLLKQYRAASSNDLEAARLQAVVELLLVIAGSEKDMKHMSDHVKIAKECIKILGSVSKQPSSMSVEDEIVLWLERIIKVRPDKVSKALLDRFKAQAQATMQLALPDTQFEEFAKRVSRVAL